MFRSTLPLFLLLGGCAQKTQVDAIDARLKALEEKVAAGGGASAKGTPAAPSPEEEAAKRAAKAPKQANFLD